MKSLAVIPARGGSKRIPRKNIRNFCGVPIIAHSIKCAQESGCFSEIMVSTDDQEIAELAERYGALVPFLRSESISGDYSTLTDVLESVISSYSCIGKHYDSLCCILPTAPMLTPHDIVESNSFLCNAPAVISATKFEYPIWRAFRDDNGVASMIWPENEFVRSQDLSSAYHDAGMFYWLNVKEFNEQKKIYMSGMRMWNIPIERVQDIDTESDWTIAELKYKYMQRANERIQNENC